MITDTGSSAALRAEDFGTLADGTAVHRWTLERDGTRVRVLTYGGIVQSVEVPGRDMVRACVALGLPDLARYETHSGPYFGALVGRYANRIGGACFELDGQTHRVTRNESLPRHSRRAPSAPLLVATRDGLQHQWLLEPDSVDMTAAFRDFPALSRSAEADAPENPRS
ncbi:hypothetical protein [Streptomyces sp. NPDC002785]|uniref:aldose epimerase family protein n=1 Tax=Streptomyces sp. NPDC002785 TaxID=3154543 RepID=UPI00332A1E12